MVRRKRKKEEEEDGLCVAKKEAFWLGCRCRDVKKSYGRRGRRKNEKKEEEEEEEEGKKANNVDDGSRNNGPQKKTKMQFYTPFCENSSSFPSSFNRRVNWNGEGEKD